MAVNNANGVSYGLGTAITQCIATTTAKRVSQGFSQAACGNRKEAKIWARNTEQDVEAKGEINDKGHGVQNSAFRRSS